MIRCLALAFLIGLASSQRRDVKYADCGSKAEIKSIQIEPCDSDPCVLKRGETSQVHFSIISDQDTETAELSGKFKAWFLWVPIPFFGQDMCDDILKCPIVKGQTLNGAMPVLISPYTPPMKTSVEFKIAGDKGTGVCFRTKVVIK
uniref:Putative ml domain protein n=1 Tax=Amblyomma sculptum TaxID=1581419 RepID=A0A1E1XQT5_AMBSC